MRSRNSKTFSWKRVLGWSQIKQRLSRELGIPLTRAGVERKIGNFIVGLLFPKKSKRKASKLHDGDAEQQ
ncbi:MAG: hypothetical protein IJ244_01495 [Bacteroidaceae bacterium]|nr:hypothetical protein [Bacteroidaceae bacterium]